MSPWHAALKRSNTLRAYFAGIADSLPQNTVAKFSIIERLVPGRFVFENSPAVPVLASSLETVVPSRLTAQSLVHPRHRGRLVFIARIAHRSAAPYPGELACAVL